jgi:thiol-disulfide isomerase/thioredoxin
MKSVYVVASILFILVGAGLGVLFSTPGTEVAREAIVGDVSSSTDEMKQKPKGDPYNEITKPSGFVNTPPITIGELVGKKVILIDFMTYSCINCQRTFPYLNAWYEKYKDQGLEIVGIHTPEFAFEKNIENVREAMKKFGITHPVVLDNDFGTWNAYGNQYWPRKYLIDIYGNIVYDHIGEGAYDVTEQKIQELLKERAEVLGDEGGAQTVLVSSAIPEVTNVSGSPETYFGAWRNNNFGSGLSGIESTVAYPAPTTAQANILYLPGTWSIKKEYAESVSKSRVMFRYSAKSVYFVAGAETANEMEVMIDGAPVPESIQGADVYYKNGRSYVTIEKNQLYKIIEGGTRETHLLEFSIPQSGLKAFTFTFG